MNFTSFPIIFFKSCRPQKRCFWSKSWCGSWSWSSGNSGQLPCRSGADRFPFSFGGFDKLYNFDPFLSRLALATWSTQQGKDPSTLVQKRRTPGCAGSSSTAATTSLSPGLETRQPNLSTCKWLMRPMTHEYKKLLLFSLYTVLGPKFGLQMSH